MWFQFQLLPLQHWDLITFIPALPLVMIIAHFGQILTVMRWCILPLFHFQLPLWSHNQISLRFPLTSMIHFKCVLNPNLYNLYNQFTNGPECTCEPICVLPYRRLPPGDDSCLCTPHWAPHAWEENFRSDPPYPCWLDGCLSGSDPQAVSFLKSSAWAANQRSALTNCLKLSILLHSLTIWSYIHRCMCKALPLQYDHCTSNVNVSINQFIKLPWYFGTFQGKPICNRLCMTNYNHMYMWMYTK